MSTRNALGGIGVVILAMWLLLLAVLMPLLVGAPVAAVWGTLLYAGLLVYVSVRWLNVWLAAAVVDDCPGPPCPESESESESESEGE